MQHALRRRFMIRGEGSGEKGTLRQSSDAYAGIADLCIPLVSRKRWPLSLRSSHCRLGLLSSVFSFFFFKSCVTANSELPGNVEIYF